MVSLGVDDQGTRAAAEPTRVLVFADECSGMLLPIAVFDPDCLAFLIRGRARSSGQTSRCTIHP
jgi:hypothetical protein